MCLLAGGQVVYLVYSCLLHNLVLKEQIIPILASNCFLGGKVNKKSEKLFPPCENGRKCTRYIGSPLIFDGCKAAEKGGVAKHDQKRKLGL